VKACQFVSHDTIKFQGNAIAQSQANHKVDAMQRPLPLEVGRIEGFFPFNNCVVVLFSFGRGGKVVVGR
jgi:hypothetical protein